MMKIHIGRNSSKTEYKKYGFLQENDIKSVLFVIKMLYFMKKLKKIISLCSIHNSHLYNTGMTQKPLKTLIL